MLLQSLVIKYLAKAPIILGRFSDSQSSLKVRIGAIAVGQFDI